MRRKPSRGTVIRGVLEFHSETGTEGGYWAVQNERFTGIPSDALKCKRCTRVGKPVGSDTPSYREISEVEVPCTPSSNPAYEPGEEFPEHDWEPMYPDGTWSYEGLHVLEDGDRLTIYEPVEPKTLSGGKVNTRGGKVVWDGTIKLIQYPLFQEEAQGLWIHADQEGVGRTKWSTWFFKGYPCRLVTKR